MTIPWKYITRSSYFHGLLFSVYILETAQDLASVEILFRMPEVSMFPCFLEETTPLQLGVVLIDHEIILKWLVFLASCIPQGCYQGIPLNLASVEVLSNQLGVLEMSSSGSHKTILWFTRPFTGSAVVSSAILWWTLCDTCHQ